jgi:hypothetical protein
MNAFPSIYFLALLLAAAANKTENGGVPTKHRWE